jgi:RNA polymerase sigma factor (sigma-70 family)
MATAQLGAAVRHFERLYNEGTDSGLDDAQLLERFVTRHDVIAFESIIARHGPMVRSVCLGVLGNANDAEDAFQAAFLVLVRRAATIRGAHSLGGWLHKVAYRVAVQARVEVARRRSLERKVAKMERAETDAEEMSEELRAALHDEVARLPDRYRLPVVLCYLEGRTHAHAAHDLRCGEATLRRTLAAARDRLRRRLSRRGLAPAAPVLGVLLAREASGAVPEAWNSAALRAAMSVGTQRTIVAGAVSATASAVAREVIRTMGFSKVKLVASTFLGAIVLGAAATAVLVPRHSPTNHSSSEAPAPEQAAQADAARPARAVLNAGDDDQSIVRGRVLDPDGKPVAGAKLYLSARAGHTLKEPPYPVRATSGDDGRFAFTFSWSEERQKSEAVDPWLHSLSNPILWNRDADAIYQVLAVGKGYGCAWVTVGAPSEELTLRLVPDEPVKGQLLDSDGQPVAGAKLTVTGVCPADKGNAGRTFAILVHAGFDSGGSRRGWVGPLGEQTMLTTRADGTFALSGVGRGRGVALRLEGRSLMTEPVLTQGVSFVHRAGISRPVHGMVRERATGKPLPGVMVGLVPNYQKRYNPMSSRYTYAITDKDGRYEVPNVPKTSYDGLMSAIPARGQLYLQNTVKFQHTPGFEPMTIDIELTKGVTVVGKVTDKETGRPVANAMVEYFTVYPNPYVVKSIKGTDPHSVAITGPDGSYALAALPGKGMIGVVARTKSDVYAPAYVTLEERKAFLKTPTAFRTYDLLWANGSGGGLGADGLPNDHHAVVLIEPSEKDTELVRDITLESAQQRQGRVVGADGQALAGVVVEGLSSDGSRRETLQRAEFTVRGINLKAPRTLIFQHKDKQLGLYVKDLRDVKVEPLTIQLQPFGSMSGRLVDQDGQPVADKRVELEYRDAGGWKEVATDKDGRFRVDGMIPGRHYVIIRPDGGRSPLVFVETEPGKNKDLGTLNIGK